MLTWISEQAKWVIYIFIVFIIIGLLFMDNMDLQGSGQPKLGEVNGREIPIDLFQAQMQNYQAQNRDRNLTDADISTMRTQLFNQMIQRELLNEEMSKLGVQASIFEMQQDLRNDPPPGVQESPLFMTDSVFDPAKYEAWLSNDSTYDIPDMIRYEMTLKSEKIPMKQMQTLVAAGYHLTDLEAAWSAKGQSTRARFEYFYLPFDSVKVDDAQVTEAMLDDYLKSEPDSFYVSEDMRDFEYVFLKIEASGRDDHNTLNYAILLHKQLKDGADFAEMATLNSEDQGSATNGGSLGDYTSVSSWVKPFAEAALKLDSGEISDPVRSQFGYHIILSHGKKAVEGDSLEHVKASHILLTVAPGTETTDSLRIEIEKLKATVEAGADFKASAEAAGIQFANSGYLAKGASPDELGYFSGLGSYGFSEKPQNDEKYSEVLQNKDYIALFLKKDFLKAGTISKELHKKRALRVLKNRLQSQQAQKLLEAEKSKLIAMIGETGLTDSLSGPVLYDSVSWVARDGFINGVGLMAMVPQVLNQQIGEWGQVLNGDRASLMVRLKEKSEPDEVQLRAAMNSEKSNAVYAMQGLFGSWLAQLVDNAEVVNNLDLYFRD
jgi:peptidyl-prolyl cis-trans isomerase D